MTCPGPKGDGDILIQCIRMAQGLCPYCASPAAAGATRDRATATGQSQETLYACGSKVETTIHHFGARPQ